MHCPYCLKDLTSASRLFGKDVFLMHMRMHEADLINRIYSAIGSIDWHYKTKNSPVPGVVRLLLDEYNEVKRFHQILKESTNEEQKIQS